MQSHQCQEHIASNTGIKYHIISSHTMFHPPTHVSPDLPSLSPQTTSPTARMPHCNPKSQSSIPGRVSKRKLLLSAGKNPLHQPGSFMLVLKPWFPLTTKFPMASRSVHEKSPIISVKAGESLLCATDALEPGAPVGAVGPPTEPGR